jgi:hypothetical protein
VSAPQIEEGKRRKDSKHTTNPNKETDTAVHSSVPVGLGGNLVLLGSGDSYEVFDLLQGVFQDGTDALLHLLTDLGSLLVQCDVLCGDNVGEIGDGGAKIRERRLQRLREGDGGRLEFLKFLEHCVGEGVNAGLCGRER